MDLETYNDCYVCPLVVGRAARSSRSNAKYYLCTRCCGTINKETSNDPRWSASRRATDVSVEATNNDLKRLECSELLWQMIEWMQPQVDGIRSKTFQRTKACGMRQFTVETPVDSGKVIDGD
ncbi:hypothetical protein DM860_009190 [Cuscuta australis]|uniref:Uncharacterized protein n=1 Tax=Cuscuta australis TaxID=267555 RepID=A0A328DFK6_9ASTE|nr:hypothetical protein DM860_009190 [Cuscuta australis]